jgi:dephospho-CoA kinase
MKVIGLTGGIASGKSTVAGFLKELGAVIIDADKVGHEAFEPNTQSWREVVDAFGKEVLTPDGQVDRQKLGQIVFSDPEKLTRLNQIVHPRIYTLVKARLEDYRQKGVKLVVLELPLLVEVPLSVKAGQPTLSDELDEVWVASAPEAVVLQRLKGKSGLSESEARARIHSQLPSKERLKHADVVIDSDCSLAELRGKVKKLWRSLA